MWECSHLPANAPKYLNERSLAFHSWCWLLGQHQHSQWWLLLWHDTHCRGGPHSLLQNRQPWLTVVSETNAFPALWNISSQLPWQLDEGVGTLQDGQGAHGVCRSRQVMPATSCTGSCSSSGLKTSWRWDQAELWPRKLGQAGACTKGKCQKQHKQACSLSFHTGRAFSSDTLPSSPSLSAVSKLQSFTYNGFLSRQVSCLHWQEKDKLVGNFAPPPTHFQPGFSPWLDPRSRESCQAPAETLAVGLGSQTSYML